MKKSKNKFLHRWIDDGAKDGKQIHCYTCKKCGKRKIKSSAYSASYYDENNLLTGYTAPECVKQPQGKT